MLFLKQSLKCILPTAPFQKVFKLLLFNKFNFISYLTFSPFTNFAIILPWFAKITLITIITIRFITTIIQLQQSHKRFNSGLIDCSEQSFFHLKKIFFFNFSSRWLLWQLQCQLGFKSSSSVWNMYWDPHHN